MKVKNFMTRDLTAVTTDATLKQAASLLSKANLLGVTVVDKEQRVVGFLSEKDLIQAVIPYPLNFTHDSIFVRDFSRILRDLSELSEKKVGDVMSSDPLVVNEEQTTEEISEIMLGEKIKIIPVVRGKGRTLIGVVTRSDLLKALFEGE